MDNLVPVGAGLIVILALLLSNKTEGFGSEIASMGSMPRNNISSESGLSLFMNFYPRLGQDFKLFDFLQKLKLNSLDPIWNGVYKTTTQRNLFKSKKLPPIILVPGLGATPIFAKWNKDKSETVRSVDESGNFEKTDSWNCKQVQDSWVQIWYPDIEGLANTCWSDNTKVNPTTDGKGIQNSDGVRTTTQEFGSTDFQPDEYMGTLITALEAVGYIQGENLFGAGYDFRRIGDTREIDSWCLSLTKLIERSCSDQENPAIIIGHDLGSVVANYFLVGALQQWKDQYIKSFITISGTFGGCPKALRALLSGLEVPGDFNKTIKNFSGVSLMLPSPQIYGDNPLVHFNQMSYTSYDIPELLDAVSSDMSTIYKICKTVREKSMKAPGVPVYIMCGDDLGTESSYKYTGSLLDNPQKNSPFYQVELPVNQKFNYNDYFIGDGTVPRFALEFPIFWTKSQKEPITFQFFTGAEHTKILSMYEPIRYLLGIIQ